jgi:hypothetical protein
LFFVLGYCVDSKFHAPSLVVLGEWFRCGPSEPFGVFLIGHWTHQIINLDVWAIIRCCFCIHRHEWFLQS